MIPVLNTALVALWTQRPTLTMKGTEMDVIGNVAVSWYTEMTEAQLRADPRFGQIEQLIGELGGYPVLTIARTKATSAFWCEEHDVHPSECGWHGA